MFAIPGILGLLFFVYLRPQEAVERLQDIPFLYMFFGLTLFGAAVDLRLRVTRAVAIPHLPWALAFYLWSVVTVSLTAPDALLRTMVIFAIIVVVFSLVAEGVQSFRMFELVAAALAGIALVLALIGVHQGRAPTQCVVIPEGDTSNGKALGTPDGRPCDTPFACYQEGAEPDADYWCERVGVLGTHTVAGRVRYRGVLQDPNELSLAISSGLALALGLWLRRRKRSWALLALFSLLFTAWCVKYTGSRSGQLGFLAVLAVFFFWRYRWRAVAFSIPLAIPALFIIASGEGRRDADQSTEERYEAWRTGIDLFRSSPVWGVGQGQFTSHHYLTAHNTYVLVLAETGAVGLFLFSMLVWIGIKTSLTAMRRYQGHPEARVAEIWSVAILASFAAIASGAAFLSFAYHYIMWIFLGLSGSLYVCIKRHDPEFHVRVGFLDVVGVGLVDGLLFLGIHLFLRYKGF